MKHIWTIFAGITMLTASVYITGCVKGDFDEPPIYIPSVDFEANTTIASLKASYNGFRQIEEDIIISGLVVANDESGNLYKKLIIQDETAGIELSLDKTNLYNEYKLGQRVFVKCKDMYIGDYNNLIQLGYIYEGGIGRMPEVLFPDHLFRDSLPGAVPEPQIAQLGNLNYSLLSMLVKFEDVNFSEVGEMWAPQTADATNRTLVGSGGSLAVRTSKYSNFASEPVPDGYGDVSGILSIFGSTYQLTLRDTSDLHGFSNGEPPPPVGDFVYPLASITPLENLDEKFDNVTDNADISLPGWTVQASAGTRYWRGRVYQSERYAQATAYQASDPEIKTWMVTPPVIYDPGMMLSFKSAMAYYNHDGLSVWMLYNYDGTNQEEAVWEEVNANLAGAASGDHTWISSGEIDLSSILPGGYNGNIYIGFLYEGSPTNTTTYRIDDVLIGENGGGGGGGTGAGTQSNPYDIATAIQLQNQSITGWVKGYIVGTVKDGINTVGSSDDLQFSGPFVRNTNVLLADDASETNYTNILVVNLPAGTALRSQVNLVDNPDNLGKWLNVNGTLRSYFGIAGSRDSEGGTTEFELEGNGGGGGGGGNSIFFEDFDNDLGSFSAYSVNGQQEWHWDIYDNGCVVMTGYDDGSYFANEDWLISPAISLAGETGVTMNFREAINYITSINDLKVLISTDYDGSGNPLTSGNWTELTGFNRAPGNSWTFFNSGDVSLAAYEGETIHIAFKYVCGTASASTWEISKVEVK
jgi:hypothetical protein